MSTWKQALEIKRYEEHFTTLIEKQENKFPCLYSGRFCHYEILKYNNILLNPKKFLHRACESFLTCFQVVSVSNESCEYESFIRKQKQCHIALSLYHNFIYWLCNLRIILKKYFRFQWNCIQPRVKAMNNQSHYEIYF